MTHQLDTVEVCERARRKKERVTMLSTFPKIVNRIASHLGIIPPSNPSQIGRIIEKSIAFNILNGLISLERQGCTVEYKDLSLTVQEAVMQTLQNPKNGMERILRAIVTNIPSEPL